MVLLTVLFKLTCNFSEFIGSLRSFFHYRSMPAQSKTRERPSFTMSDESFIAQVEATREALCVFTTVAAGNTPVARVAMEELVNTTVCSISYQKLLTSYSQVLDSIHQVHA
jgi:hypothetical protein